jgi:type IV secretion system protein VirB6/type IV secretion system protein TrbL
MVLVAIMAWMLAYGGIFLLGFGGARWTSLIAINYYKHAVAVGIALLALLMLMTYGFDFLNGVAAPLVGGSEIGYIELADMFVVALIMAVLGIKLPGLLYTLVTGSPLGLLAGTASMAGTAIMTGGGGAIAAATNAVAQHTSSRRENHYASAVDAFRNVSPDLQRGDTMYQDMNVGAYGLGTANGQPPAKPGGQVFGGTPPVSVWNGGAGGQPAGQPHQVSAQASAQTLQESNAGAGHAPANTESPQAVSQGGAYASAQNPGSAGSIPSAVSGTATDQAGSQPTLDTSSIGQAASLGTSGIEHMSAGGFQPTSLQPSTNSATGNPQQIQQAASTMSSDSAQAPVGGFQPTALSSAITQREGARASTQTGASLPPIPAPLTQDVEETITRRIKQKAVDQRETSIDPGMIGSNHRTNGKPPAADANDEVAAFRDRRSPWGEDDAKGGTT